MSICRRQSVSCYFLSPAARLWISLQSYIARYCNASFILHLRVFTYQTTPSARDLGVVIDLDLSLQTNINRTVSCCFNTLRQLRNIRRQVPTAVFQSLVVALVLSRLDYCNSVLAALPANLIRCLQSVQNAAARLIYGYGAPSTLQTRSLASIGFASRSASCSRSP